MLFEWQATFNSYPYASAVASGVPQIVWEIVDILQIVFHGVINKFMKIEFYLSWTSDKESLVQCSIFNILSGTENMCGLSSYASGYNNFQKRFAIHKG